MKETRAKYIVYKHTFPDGKVYVGMTRQTPQRRWGKGSGYNNVRLMKEAIKRFGWDNVEHKVLFSGLSFEEACEKEIETILLYNSADPERGYNTEKGGNGAEKITDSIRVRMSRSAIKRCKNEKERVRMREIGLKGSTGRSVSKETRQRIGNANSISNACPIGQYDRSGELIEIFSSAAKASVITGVAKCNICRVAMGQRKTAGGYIWKREGSR